MLMVNLVFSRFYSACDVLVKGIGSTYGITKMVMKSNVSMVKAGVVDKLLSWSQEVAAYFVFRPWNNLCPWPS